MKKSCIFYNSYFNCTGNVEYGNFFLLDFDFCDKNILKNVLHPPFSFFPVALINGQSIT